MKRITEKELEAIVNRINRVAGTPLEPYSRDENKQLRPNAFNYHLSFQYGGVALEQMGASGGGRRRIFDTTSKRELAEKMYAFVAGLEAKKGYAQNPRPRIGASKPGRVSSVTGMRPTKRLVSRRKANTRKGYFPNPGPGVSTPKIIALARKHVANDVPMQSSARFALAEAVEAETRGDLRAAKMWAAKSLAYSVGVFHADYKKAAKAAEYDYKKNPAEIHVDINSHNQRVTKPRRNPVRPLAKRAGIRFYRQAGAKWLMLDPLAYPAKTKAEAQKIARALAKMFKAPIKVVIDK